MTPALPPLPPLQLAQSSSASAKGGDGAFGGAGGSGVSSGDWNVSYASGNATSAAGVNWLYLALAAGAAWFLARR